MNCVAILLGLKDIAASKPTLTCSEAKRVESRFQRKGNEGLGCTLPPLQPPAMHTPRRRQTHSRPDSNYSSAVAPFADVEVARRSYRRAQIHLSTRASISEAASAHASAATSPSASLAAMQAPIKDARSWSQRLSKRAAVSGKLGAAAPGFLRAGDAVENS